MIPFRFSKTSLMILKDLLQILKDLNREEQLTIVMVTHDRDIAKEAGRTVCLREGLVDEVGRGIL